MGRALRALLAALTLVGPTLVLTAQPAHAASTFTVVNTAASGLGSLQQALADANTNPGADTIVFNVPGPGVHTIAVAKELIVTDTVVIDASTQPGWSGSPLIELNGATSAYDGCLGHVGFCLKGPGPSDSVIRGFAINRYDMPIVILSHANRIRIENNYIGTDPTGTLARPNHKGVAVGEADNALIVGNLISGNSGPGVHLLSGGTENTIDHNFIGTTADGSAALPNVGGIVVDPGVTRTKISHNVISGNTNKVSMHVVTASSSRMSSGSTGPAPNPWKTTATACSSPPAPTSSSTTWCPQTTATGSISTAQSAGSTLTGNRIGTDLHGELDRGNGGNGIAVVSERNIIGGPDPTQGNVIGGNGADGISIGANTHFAGANVVLSNFIGTNASGADLGNDGAGVHVGFVDFQPIGAPGSGNHIAHNGGPGVGVHSSATLRVSIRGNHLFDNEGLGIDLAEDGPTPNDQGDGDAGPNWLQNVPRITTLAPEAVSGVFDSVPSSSGYTIDVYTSTTCDPSGHGEGRHHVGASDGVDTDGAERDVGGDSFDASSGGICYGHRDRHVGQHVGVFASVSGKRRRIRSRCRLTTGSVPTPKPAFF